MSYKALLGSVESRANPFDWVSLLPEPVKEFRIQFKHGLEGTSEVGTCVPVYVRMPNRESPNGFPLIMQIMGLDKYDR